MAYFENNNPGHALQLRCMVSFSCLEIEREDNRILSIKAVIDEGQFIFACRNSFVNDNYPGIKSKKKDVIPHGYGLSNIKDAVNRNKGTYYFEKEDKEFVSVVIIPV